MDIWIRKFAYDWAQADEVFLLNDNLHHSNPTNPSYEERRIRRSAELFPSFYDLRFLEGGNRTKGGTFRVLVNDDDDDDEHQLFMKTVSFKFQFNISCFDVPKNIVLTFHCTISLSLSLFIYSLR